MQITILSDIHSNYYALERVLDHAQQSGVDRYWLLGDLVGYGPHPVECMRWFKDNHQRIDWVMGNHDAMLMAWVIRERIRDHPKHENQLRRANALALKELAEVEGDSEKNKDRSIAINNAILALLLNKKTLGDSPELDEFWQETFDRGHYGPQKIDSESIEYWIVHASRREGRQIGEYIYPWSSHLLKLELQALLLINQKEPKSTNTPVCQLHGHSHVPYIVTLDRPDMDGNWQPACAEPGRSYPLGKSITLANPGSVGQPRNGDQRACYAMLDTEQQTITFHRIAYDYKKTSRDLATGKYPNPLVERLEKASYPSDIPPTEQWIECMKSLRNQAGI
jgi:predicted phosphodiesterase